MTIRPIINKRPSSISFRCSRDLAKRLGAVTPCYLDGVEPAAVLGDAGVATICSADNSAALVWPLWPLAYNFTHDKLMREASFNDAGA